MNMQVGIVTIEDYRNYGNRLQNYAVHRLIEQYGLKPVNIRFEIKSEILKFSKSPAKKFLKNFLPMPALYRRQHYRELKEKRVRNFWNFSEDTMGKTYRIFVNQYREIAEKIKEDDFSCFIAGSDQIWNPDYEGDAYYFLTFAKPEKRIAFAASIGQSQLPEEVKARYAPMLKEMRYISVREEAASSLVKEMTGRKADVILDPTLLLGRKQWENLAREPDVFLPKQYIAAFFLGNLPGKAIKDFAEKAELPVVYLNHRGYQELYVLDPAEFLYVLEHATYVMTDSFHGTAFSILFERQFFVFRRKQAGMKDMFSRLETLLQGFGLKGREQPWSGVEEIPPVTEEKWRQVRRRLEQERSRADKILGSMLQENWEEEK